jgi:hypothetical protein
VAGCLQPAATLFGTVATAFGAITTDLEAANNDVKAAVALDLTFQAIEEVAFEFHDFAATQARHVDMISLWAPLVVVLFALHVHEIELVHQSIALEKVKRSIDRHAINARVQLACVAKDLSGVKMLFGGFDYAQDRAALVSEPKAARGQCSLQTSRGFGFRKRHFVYETVLQ